MTHVLFVGGALHGTTAYIANDLTSVQAEDPRCPGSRQRYDERRWALLHSVHGFDALMVHSVSDDELAERVRDAMGIARANVPLEPRNGEPYFTVPAEGWGTGWSADEPQGIINYETGDYVYRAPDETVEQMRARYDAWTARQKG